MGVGVAVHAATCGAAGSCLTATVVQRPALSSRAGLKKPCRGSPSAARPPQVACGPQASVGEPSRGAYVSPASCGWRIPPSAQSAAPSRAETGTNGWSCGLECGYPLRRAAARFRQPRPAAGPRKQGTAFFGSAAISSRGGGGPVRRRSPYPPRGRRRQAVTGRLVGRQPFNRGVEGS